MPGDGPDRRIGAPDRHGFPYLQKVLHIPLDKRGEICRMICIHVAAFANGDPYGTVHRR